ncbi:hypothetical protein ACFQPA_05225 [Halomarina halobia]|uniref:Uncharacterized protein n=1 Tax=Halomarina halobia TaxID=3033386 RepID=A0ABD6A6S0_9EURY|nr:hypothetical protein [Halomarina sp. PSR21]
MNHLAPAGEGAYHLPRHAHVIVYTARDDGELVTVYDCGAAQKPPVAQFIGHLVRVQADARTDQSPTGYVVRLREGGVLEEQGDGEWVIRSAPA